MTTPRQATPEDRRSAIRTVASAFASDPAWRFMLGSDYDRLAPLFAGALFDQRVSHGTVWVIEEAAAVAMWDAPGRHGSDDEERAAVWRAFHEAAGPFVTDQVVRYDAALAAVAPLDEHWYLGVLAADPERWGTGLASAVVEPGLSRADADGVACCLETSTVSNRAFYQRRGFTQATPVALDGGPPTWWMTRPAAAART